MTAKLAAARVLAAEIEPYLAAALWRLTFTVVPAEKWPKDCPGEIAVDAIGRGVVNEALLARATVRQLAGALAHEAGHLVRDHAARRMGREPLLWNMACFPSGVTLPAGVPIERAATMRRLCDGPLLRIVTQAGTVEATPEHPFMARRRLRPSHHPVQWGSPEWIAAGDLREKDFVCIPRFEDRRRDDHVDLSGYIRQGTDGLGRRTFGNRAVHEIPLTEETAWLIGLYVAEGSASPAVRFSLGSHEREIADRVRHVADGIGYSTSVSVSCRRQTSMAVTLGTTVFGRWLKEACGDAAKRKHVPEVILRHERAEIRRAFVDGLITGDGYEAKCRGIDIHVLGTTSAALARDLVLLLAQDDIGTNFNVLHKGPRQIGGGWTESQLELFRVAFRPKGRCFSTRVMNGRVVATRHGRWRIDEVGVWVPIRKLEEVPFSGEVFNLTTPRHTYIANAFLVHNCDATINPNVLEAGHELPYKREEIVLPERLPTNPPDGLAAETYYELLEAHALKVTIGVPGESCGSCAGNRSSAEDLLGPAGPAEAAAGLAEWATARVEVAQAIRAHAKARGKLPGGWQRWAEESLAASKIPWQRLLAVAVRGALRRSGAQDWTWSRPSRRRLATGPILPALRSPEIRAAVVIDTSGSIGDKELGEALVEVKGILRGAGACVEVIAVDAAVQSRGMVATAKQATKHAKGGGGTDMGVGLEAAAKESRGRRPEVVVVLTDAESPWPSARPRALRRVIVVVPEGAPPTPAWARRIERT